MKVSIAILLLVYCFSAKAQDQPLTSGNQSIHILKASEKVVIARNGTANLPIIISNNASKETEAAANDLSHYLSKISTAKFSVHKRADDHIRGIYVAVQNDFPASPLKSTFDVNHPGESQGFEIKSHTNGIYITGATPLATTFAVYHFLNHFGYRYFFPMKKWEIIPKIQTLEFSAYIKEVPDYYHRRVWPGFGVWPADQETSDKWDAVNHNGGYPLKTGHSYDTIRYYNKEKILKHPEYSALINGKRIVDQENPKFCISNPGLQSLVVDYALDRFSNNADLKSLSTDPSDGGGWCECVSCLKIGSPSTRAVLLSNIVAKAVRTKFQGKRIGMYAYNQHSPPPEIDVDQDVVVSIATSFIRGGLSLEEIMLGWQKKKAVLGIRDYYDVYIWSKMLPGKSLASNTGYLKKSIPEFYHKGVRYLSSESSDDWGPGGLGYYMANHLLWNIKNSEKADTIRHDFLDKCFGASALTMAKFYVILDGTKPKVLSSDLIGQMYRLLHQARLESAADPDILSRLDDLVLYTRYVDLFAKFERSKSTDQQKNFDEMTGFMASIKNSRMIHTKAIANGTHWEKMVPNAKKAIVNWDTPVSYSNLQIENFLRNGIEENKLLDFETVDYSEQLVPAPALVEKNYPEGYLKPRRGERSYYVWVDESLKPIEIKVTGGLIPHYRDRGHVKVKLFKIGGASDDGTLETLIKEDASTPPNGISNMVSLYPNQQGLYKITISDGNDMTEDVWINYNKIFKSKGALEGTFYFYVPKGTKKIGFYANLKSGELLDPKGNPVYTFNNVNDYKSIAIPESKTGKIWAFKKVSGEINLLTVPPYFSTIADNFLLPREVTIQDKLEKNHNLSPR